MNTEKRVVGHSERSEESQALYLTQGDVCVHLWLHFVAQHAKEMAHAVQRSKGGESERDGKMSSPRRNRFEIRLRQLVMMMSSHA